MLSYFFVRKSKYPYLYIIAFLLRKLPWPFELLNLFLFDYYDYYDYLLFLLLCELSSFYFLGKDYLLDYLGSYIGIDKFD